MAIFKPVPFGESANGLGTARIIGPARNKQISEAAEAHRWQNAPTQEYFLYFKEVQRNLAGMNWRPQQRRFLCDGPLGRVSSEVIAQVIEGPNEIVGA